MIQRFIPAVLLLSFHAIALSDTIHIPADYPTIQDAIDAARTRDVLIVAPGIYKENIDFKGMDIVIESSDGPLVTIIDGNQSGSVAAFKAGETSDSVLKGFTIKNGTGYYDSLYENVGGGVYCQNASPILKDNIIKNNKGYRGGGIYCYGTQCNPLIMSCTIAENTAYFNLHGGYGGGVYCEYSSANIEDCEIMNNVAGFAGGGISVFESGNPIIRKNLIDSNSVLGSVGGNGGGISVLASGEPLIEGNVLINNVARDGGGITCADGIIRGNTILFNMATFGSGSHKVGYGGGIVVKGIDPTIENNLIAWNTAMSQGGGVLYLAWAGTLINNTICHNTAAGGTEPSQARFGGGIAFIAWPTGGSGGPTLVANCSIYQNSAEHYGGGVYLLGESVAKLLNCTLTQNTADIAKGIYSESEAILTITNSILWNHTGPEIINESNEPEVTFSDVEGGWPGSGNIDEDPEFADPANHDFHLRYTSPCRDGGTNAALGAPTEDFEGDPRIAYGIADMGFDEFHPRIYYMGDAAPGGQVFLKFVGLPGTSPVGFWVGFDVFDPPFTGSYGAWYLKPPILGPIPFGPIPWDGIGSLSGKLPANPVGPYTLYLQAVIGKELTDLCVMNVEG